MSNRSFIRHRQPKGLIGQSQQLILHPVLFFKNLPEQAESRTWLWSALLTLILVGYSAVRHDATIAANTGFGGDASGDIQGQLILAISAAGGIILAWMGQIPLLALLTMLQGKKPQWGLNLRLVIWASIPLALRAISQIAYMAAGGELIDLGLLADDALADSVSEQLNFLLANFFRQITLFDFWRLILFYLGTYYSLKGSWWLALLVSIISFLALFLIPTFLQMGVK